jgi:hypothetical protein
MDLCLWEAERRWGAEVRVTAGNSVAIELAGTRATNHQQRSRVAKNHPRPSPFFRSSARGARWRSTHQNCFSTAHPATGVRAENRRTEPTRFWRSKVGTSNSPPASSRSELLESVLCHRRPAQPSQQNTFETGGRVTVWHRRRHLDRDLDCLSHWTLNRCGGQMDHLLDARRGTRKHHHCAIHN